MSRESVPAADEILDKYFPVLDNGFISLVDYMGTDVDVERAGRVSYGKGTRQISDTKKLLRYMINHRHTSVFEQVELKFHIAMPIFVARQFLRHRTFSTNEFSARYSEVPDCVYSPTNRELRKQSKNNKQGTSEECIYNQREFDTFSDNRIRDKEVTFQNYQNRLDKGWARELARIDLPLSTYTYLYAKIDLHNLLNFLSLRCDSHAQEQIRVYANVMAGMVKRLCPISFDAWVDYRYGAKTFSRLDILLLNYLQETYCDFKMNEWENCYSTDENKYHLSIGMTETKGKSRELDEFFQKILPVNIPNFDLDLSKAKEASQMQSL